MDSIDRLEEMIQRLEQMIERIDSIDDEENRLRILARWQEASDKIDAVLSKMEEADTEAK